MNTIWVQRLTRRLQNFSKEELKKKVSSFLIILESGRKKYVKKVVGAGFLIEGVDDYKEREYYQNIEELMDLIEMVPLVKNFDGEKDRETVENLAKRYWTKQGIQITWHYYILTARRF
ncbi:MAG: hypothetical protein QXX99_06570 [Candidatus Bathyarchaeia archaeon]